jgi:YD repeat-containing protein
MKTWKLIAACLAVVSFFSEGSVWSRPVDLSAPSGELGAANSKGYLEIWRQIEDAGIDFGKGSYLPLRYKFSSENNTGGILGPGFYMPMFEAKNVLIREQVMRAYLPCGKGLYFWKDQVDPTKFQTVDKEWTGALSANNDFTVWRDDGWTILYHQGRLTTITTDEHHVFTWDYDGNSHMATGISEDGKSLITVEPNQQGLVDALVFDGKRYEFGYSERPLIEMLLGHPAIGQLAIALSSLKHPDGKTETFKFVLTPDLVPTVTFTSPDQKQTAYTWDAATNHIATEQGPDGNWTYKIGDVTQDFGLPSISRTSPNGKTEGMAVDTKMGTYSSQATDGVITVTHVFETPGPLYHKVQKVEKIDGKTTTLTYHASYDELGRLIRKIDGKGFMTTYAYDEAGKITSQSVSLTPEKQKQLQTKEQALLKALTTTSSAPDRENVAKTLGYFYIHELGDSSKALALLPQISDPNSRFLLRLHAIYYGNLTAEQKKQSYQQLVSDFPDSKNAILPFLSIK